MSSQLWLLTVNRVAETARRHRIEASQTYHVWTQRQTAKRLKVTPSFVTMCLQIKRGLRQWPDLKRYSSLRQAYDVCRERLKTVPCSSRNGKTTGSSAVCKTVRN